MCGLRVEQTRTNKPGQTNQDKQTRTNRPGEFDMSISLYEASVGSYLQIVPAVNAQLDKAETHFKSQGVDLAEIVDTSLHADMLPLRFQVVSVVHHSIGTIHSMRSGVFGPPSYDPKLDFDALKGMLASTFSALKDLSADEVDGMAGNPMEFVMGDLRLPFTAENFVLSFSLPNFYFHATTVYDILRYRGLPLGKRDFMGKLLINR
jgi:hypothetical protein